MADPNKFKSISVPIAAYKKAVFLTDKYDVKVSISKIVELAITKEAKKKGYKNGKEN